MFLLIFPHKIWGFFLLIHHILIYNFLCFPEKISTNTLCQVFHKLIHAHSAVCFLGIIIKNGSVRKNTPSAVHTHSAMCFVKSIMKPTNILHNGFSSNPYTRVRVFPVTENHKSIIHISFPIKIWFCNNHSLTPNIFFPHQFKNCFKTFQIPHLLPQPLLHKQSTTTKALLPPQAMHTLPCVSCFDSFQIYLNCPHSISHS